MKRTDRLTNIIAILLFLAFVAYAGAYAYGMVSDKTVTAQAVTAQVSVGGVASGIVIREETVLTSGEPYIDVTAADGAKVRVGQVLASAMSSETGLERASRMRELELEIERISGLLQSLDSAEDLTRRDEKLSSSVRSLTTAVARGETEGLDSACLNIRSLLFGTGETATEADLKQLQAELDSLKTSSSSDTRLLTAQASGTFSSTVDGFESVSPADLYDGGQPLSPSQLQALTESQPEPADGAYGKLISGYSWYFAAVMSAADASNLSPGRYANLDFGRYYGSPISARVEAISPTEEGNVTVLFRCDTALRDTLAMRLVSANVVFEEYSGIRVPSEALRTDSETESTYVWVITAMVLERKDVEVIYAGDGFVIVSRDSDPDSLREGNTIVVSGDDLYEGKLMD
ncbi:MAG: HlyD family efflux transporter periplasmic adaptor subunit [Oscillospiraceae bacterium]